MDRMAGHDALGIRRRLKIRSGDVDYFSLKALDAAIGGVSTLPVSLKILLENLARYAGGEVVAGEDAYRLVEWGNRYEGEAADLAFHPCYVLMHDTTATPALVDLAAMRDAAAAAGADPRRISPKLPVYVSIDHSVAVDAYGTADAASANLNREFEKNRERYAFFRWAEQAFPGIKLFRPGTGICHQLNLEQIAEVVRCVDQNGRPVAFPDTLVGLDSHTPMINALGVLGWGVGGLTGGAAALGFPVSMTTLHVVGVRLTERLREGVGATDLALTLAERLREFGVVGCFLEFFGEGVGNLSLSDRATVSNMAPEYGCTATLFPIDHRTLDFLKLTGRSQRTLDLVEAYAKEQGLWHDPSGPTASFSRIIDFDLAAIERSVSGPSIPHRRMSASRTAPILCSVLPANDEPLRKPSSKDTGLRHGDVVIAAITSCTNTANPRLVIEAALLARNANRLGMKPKPWVKTSFGPGSRAVANYLDGAGLTEHLNALRFNIVGFGCTTCIGNSGRLEAQIEREIDERGVHACAVLSGNRNFDGRVNPSIRSSYLMSPAMVIAYAIAGSVKVDILREPIGGDANGRPVFLDAIWPSEDEIATVVRHALDSSVFLGTGSTTSEGETLWNALSFPDGPQFQWNPESEYLRPPRYVTEMADRDFRFGDIIGARILMLLGDNITTDHISPAGAIKDDDPAGIYLASKRVSSRDFNVYAARRGNFEVVSRGIFTNPLLDNEMMSPQRGGVTRHWPDGRADNIFTVAQSYRAEGVPTVVIAGRNFGAGSSRDWAAKGLQVLGVRAVIAESFERIHRCNLIDMGILPLQFPEGVTRHTLGLDGREEIDLAGLEDGMHPNKLVRMSIRTGTGETISQDLICRADTRHEVRLLRSGGFIAFYLGEALNESLRDRAPKT